MAIQLTEIESLNDQLARLLVYIQDSANSMASELANQIASMRAEGITDVAIKEQLLTDFETGGAGWTSINARIRSSIQDIQARFYSRPLNRQILDDELERTGRIEGDPKFFWNAMGSNTCPSCTARHGQIKPYSEWQRVGLPQSGALVCKRNCRCALLPVNKAMSIYKAKSQGDLVKKSRRGINERLNEIERLERERGKEYAQSTFEGKLGQWRSATQSLLDYRGRKPGHPQFGK